MCGWSEVKIVGVFSLVTAIFAGISFLLVMFGTKLYGLEFVL